MVIDKIMLISFSVIFVGMFIYWLGVRDDR
jgi:hypothetical protein